MVSQKAAHMLLDAADRAYCELDVTLSHVTRGLLRTAIAEARREQEPTAEQKAIIEAGHDYVVRNSE